MKHRLNDLTNLLHRRVESAGLTGPFSFLKRRFTQPAERSASVNFKRALTTHLRRSVWSYLPIGEINQEYATSLVRL